MKYLVDVGMIMGKGLCLLMENDRIFRLQEVV